MIPKFSKMKGSGDGADVRRLDRQQRYKPTAQSISDDDISPEFMNIVGMIFSLFSITFKLKGCGWIALYCACASFANFRINDNAKHIFTSFVLSISALVMCYMQHPQPMSPIWAASFT